MVLLSTAPSLVGMPRPDRPDALQAWMELSAATSLIRASVNTTLQLSAGLTLAENLVLCQVAMAPAQRMRMVQIAQTLSIAKSAVTKTVDRLEERGWLSREPDPADRRTVHAALTSEGAAAFARAQPIFAASVLDQLCGPLTSVEVAQLRRLLGKLSTNGAASPQATKGARPLRTTQ